MSKFAVTMNAKTKFLVLVEADSEEAAEEIAQQFCDQGRDEPLLRHLDPIDFLEATDVDQVEPASDYSLDDHRAMNTQ